MVSNLRLFVVPTDRPCAESLLSYVPEIQRLAGYGPVHVMIMEDRRLPPDASRDHRSAIKEVARCADGVEGSVLTQADWTALTSKREWPHVIRHMMLDEGVSYGRAFNKCALIASSLGASVIHKRDSDTSLPSVCAEVDLYPVDIEHSVLRDEDCDVVGGNYWGQWNVSLGPLVGEPDRLRLILSAHGIPVVGQNSIIDEQLPRASRPPTTERGGITRGAYPDLGNCAFRTVAALSFPAPVALDMIGTDYIFLAQAVRLGRAWLHGVSVRHEHGPERGEDLYCHDYWLRRAKQMDFLFLLHQLESVGKRSVDFESERHRLVEAIGRLPNLLEDIEPLRRVHWGAYAEAFRGSRLDVATSIASDIRGIEASAQGQNNIEMVEYRQLLMRWPQVSKHLVSELREFFGGVAS